MSQSQYNRHRRTTSSFLLSPPRRTPPQKGSFNIHPCYPNLTPGTYAYLSRLNPNPNPTSATPPQAPQPPIGNASSSSNWSQSFQRPLLESTRSPVLFSPLHATPNSNYVEYGSEFFTLSKPNPQHQPYGYNLSYPTSPTQQQRDSAGRGSNLFGPLNMNTNINSNEANDLIMARYPILHPDNPFSVGNSVQGNDQFPSVFANSHFDSNNIIQNYTQDQLSQRLTPFADDQHQQQLPEGSRDNLGPPNIPQLGFDSVPQLDKLSKPKPKPKTKAKAKATTRKRATRPSIASESAADTSLETSNTSTSFGQDEIGDVDGDDSASKPKKVRATRKSVRSSTNNAQPIVEQQENSLATPAAADPAQPKTKGKGKDKGKGKATIESASDNITLGESVKLGLGGRELAVPLEGIPLAHCGSGWLNSLEADGSCLPTNTNGIGQRESADHIQGWRYWNDAPAAGIEQTFRDSLPPAPPSTINTHMLHDYPQATFHPSAGPSVGGPQSIDHSAPSATPLKMAQMTGRQILAKCRWATRSTTGATNLLNVIFACNSYPLVAASLARLCGRFHDEPVPVPPEPTFGALIHGLARAVDSPRPALNNISNDLVIQCIFTRCITILTGTFIADEPLEHIMLPLDANVRVNLFTPPDALWAFVHIADPIFLQPFLAALQNVLEACPDTPRAVVLWLLKRKVLSHQFTLGTNTRQWALQVNQEMAWNDWTFPQNSSLGRVTIEEVDAMIHWARPAYYMPDGSQTQPQAPLQAAPTPMANPQEQVYGETYEQSEKENVNDDEAGSLPLGKVRASGSDSGSGSGSGDCGIGGEYGNENGNEKEEGEGEGEDERLERGAPTPC